MAVVEARRSHFIKGRPRGASGDSDGDGEERLRNEGKKNGEEPEETDVSGTAFHGGGPEEIRDYDEEDEEERGQVGPSSLGEGRSCACGDCASLGRRKSGGANAGGKCAGNLGNCGGA